MEPPNAACVTIALCSAPSVRMSRILRPLVSSAISACADRRAMSSQIACPERGVRATCRAPPRRPGTSQPCRETGSRRRATQARQPRSAASCGEISLCTNRTPMVCMRAASSPSTGSRVTPPGTRTQGRSRLDASAIIIAGRPLSHVATPSTPRRVGSDRISRRKIVAHRCMRKAVEHRRRALRAAVARIRARGGERDRARLFELASRRFHQQPDFPVSVWYPSATGVPSGARMPWVDRIRNSRPPSAGRLPPHAGILGPAEQVAGWPLPQHRWREGKGAGGPRNACRNVEQRGIGGIERVGTHCHISYNRVTAPLIWAPDAGRHTTSPGAIP